MSIFFACFSIFILATSSFSRMDGVDLFMWEGLVIVDAGQEPSCDSMHCTCGMWVGASGIDNALSPTSLLSFLMDQGTDPDGRSMDGEVGHLWRVDTSCVLPSICNLGLIASG